MTFKGARTTHREGSRRAGGRDSRGIPEDPPATSVQGTKGGGVKSGAWMMGHLWDRDVVEDLERSWHGGGASLVLDMAEGKEGCTVWVEIFFSLLFRRKGPKFRRKVKTPNSKGQLSILGYEITR